MHSVRSTSTFHYYHHHYYYYYFIIIVIIIILIILIIIIITIIIINIIIINVINILLFNIMFWLLPLLPFFTKDSKTLITNRHDFQYFEFALSSNFSLEVLILLHFSISLSCKLTLAGTGYDLSLFLVNYNYA